MTDPDAVHRGDALPSDGDNNSQPLKQNSQPVASSIGGLFHNIISFIEKDPVLFWTSVLCILAFIGFIVLVIWLLSISGKKPKKSCINSDGHHVKGIYDKVANKVVCPKGSCSIRDGKYLTCNTIYKEDGTIYLNDQCKCNKNTSDWDCTYSECPGDPGNKCYPINFQYNYDLDKHSLKKIQTKCKNGSHFEYYFKNNYGAQEDIQRCLERKGTPVWNNTLGSLNCIIADGSSYTINTKSDKKYQPISEPEEHEEDTENNNDSNNSDTENNNDSNNNNTSSLS